MIVGMWGESVNGVDLNQSLNSLEASQDLVICGWPLCTETYRAVEFGNYALLTLVCRNRFVFPSLEPTAYLLVFSSPRKDWKAAKHDFRSFYKARVRIGCIRSEAVRA
jgi:hypothetical protein